MKTAVLQTRIDKTLKQGADAFFESIGMDTTTAIRIFLKQTLIQCKIPFEIVQVLHHCHTICEESTCFF